MTAHRVMLSPQKMKGPRGEHSLMNEVNVIRQRAQQASQFYNKVGLSNGDLPRDLAGKNDHKQHSEIPDKRRPSSSSSAAGFSLPATQSHFKPTWLEPSKPSSKSEGGDRLKSLPSRYGPDRVPDPSASKHRSPLSSVDQPPASPRNFHKSHTSTSSDEAFTPCSTADRSKRGYSERTVSTVPRVYERKKDEAFRKQDLRTYHTNGFEKDPPSRVTSHLYTKQLSSSQTSESKLRANVAFTYTPSQALTPVKFGRKTSSSNDRKSSESDSNKRNDRIVALERSSPVVTAAEYSRQRSFSDAQRDSLNGLSEAKDHAAISSFLYSKSHASTSSLNESKELIEEDLMHEYRRNKSCHSSPNHLYKLRDVSPSASAGESPKSRRRQNKPKSKSDVPDHRILLSRLQDVQNEKEQQEFRSVASSIIQGKKHRHYFAHYDCQSMLFSFEDTVTAMEEMKKKSAPTGASKAAVLAAAPSTDSLASKGSSTCGSQEDVSTLLEEDCGLQFNKSNAIVASIYDGITCRDPSVTSGLRVSVQPAKPAPSISCPFFRNEIGGETDRTICISATPGQSVQVGNDADQSTTEAQNVLTNHTYLSVVEHGSSDNVMPPNSPTRGSVSFGIENVDAGAHYYRTHFYEKDHQNFFGFDDRYGPVVISFRREKIDDKTSVYHYRIIVRTCELRTLRGSILEDVVSSSKYPPSKGYPAKDVLEFVCPEISTASLKVALPTPKVHEQIMKIDEQNVSSSYKVGVLYCKAGQVTEEDMYNNEHGSPAFQQFLDLLGTTVKLQGFDDFKGGLDVKTDSTGTESVFTTFNGYKIMFHVSTLLPFTATNRQQLLRKRHIGNDILTIVFQEPGSEPFNPKHMRSHFQHVFVVVRVHNPCTPDTCYSIAVTRSINIPRFGPLIPENALFPPSSSFRAFLLTKIINGENTAHTAGRFKVLAMNTREQYLRDLVQNNASQNGLEGTPRYGRFSITAASRRIKEGKDKQKLRPMPEIWSRGSITWKVNAHDYSQSESVPCLLGISDCSLSVHEVATRQVIFSIPSQAVLGWGVPSSKRDLNIYYGRGEKVWLEVEDFDARNEILLRLRRFTKGTETIHRQLRRRGKELGFKVNYEGIIVELKPNGCAANDGLKQSSRLVEICKISVATMTHEHINDTLRNSAVVTVVLIPPNDDGTPRKCSMELYHLYPVLQLKKADPSALSTRGNHSAEHYDETDGFPNGELPDPLEKIKIGKPLLTKTYSGKNTQATLFASSSRQAMVGRSSRYARTNKKITSTNKQPAPPEAPHVAESGATYSNNLVAHSTNHINSDWSEGLTGKHTLSNTSLSSDSGLNSNNNSSYASTLSRCSNNAASSQQQLKYELLQNKLSSYNTNSNNNNNNNNNIHSTTPNRQTFPRSNPPIRGIVWNSTRTLPISSCAHIHRQPTSEKIQFNTLPITTRTDLENELRKSPHQHTRSEPVISSLQAKPVPTPRLSKKYPSPSPRRYTGSPKHKRTATDVPPSPALAENLKNSSTTSLSMTPDVQSTIIKLLTAESLKKSTSVRSTSPTRTSRQRSSPERKVLFPDSLPSPPLRTLSDESLCGARTEKSHSARQDARFLDKTSATHKKKLSASVDSLAQSPLRGNFNVDFPLTPHLPTRKLASFPLPASHDWDELVGAANAAAGLEASSVKSVSLGTLNELHDDHVRPLTLLSQRTVSVEQVRDQHDYDATINHHAPPYSFNNLPHLSPHSSLNQSSNDAEERLERIETKLRLLQEQLQEERNSKKKLEKELTSLRRDNTLLLHHVRGSNPDYLSGMKQS